MPSGRALILGAVALLVLVCGGSWAIDFVAASAVGLHAAISPPVLPADGHSSGTLVVRVTNPDGTPRVGDTIEVLDEGPGIFDRTRALIDQHGEVRFLYTTSKSNRYQPAAPVPVLVTDTSLGHVVEVDKNLTIRIDVVDPAKLRKGH